MRRIRPHNEGLELSTGHLDDIFGENIQPVMDARQYFAHSTVITLTGVQASGKSTLAHTLPARLNIADPYILEWDDLFLLHPKSEELRLAIGENKARRLVDRTSFTKNLFVRSQFYALDNGINLAIPGVICGSYVKDDFNRWRSRQEGVCIHAAAVTLSKERNQLIAIDRYLQALAATGSGLWIQKQWFEFPHSEIPRSMDYIEREGLADYTHNVNQAGQFLYSNKLVSRDPKVIWQTEPRVAAAVIDEQSRLWTRAEHQDFNDRAKRICKAAERGELSQVRGGVAFAADVVRRGIEANQHAIEKLRDDAAAAAIPKRAIALSQEARIRQTYNNELQGIAQSLRRDGHGKLERMASRAWGMVHRSASNPARGATPGSSRPSGGPTAPLIGGPPPKPPRAASPGSSLET